MRWRSLDKSVWQLEHEEAVSREFNGNYNIIGTDIDPTALDIARENAARAGVSDIVRFEKADATKFDRVTENGIIVTNPPYGERIMENRRPSSFTDFSARRGAKRKTGSYTCCRHIRSLSAPLVRLRIKTQAL